jgi:ComF family protein
MYIWVYTAKTMDVVRSILSIIFPARHEEDLVASITDEALTTLVSPRRVHSCTALTNYADARIRALVWEAKYYKNGTACARMGTVLAHHIATIEHTMVIPIPLSSKRFASRGFNQVVLALQAGNIPHIETDILLRSRDTLPQTHLPRSSRLTNLVGAFTVPAHMREHVCDARIVLVDDVVTTGATLEEARRTLLRAGAAQVECLAFAHS